MSDIYDKMKKGARIADDTLRQPTGKKGDLLPPMTLELATKIASQLVEKLEQRSELDKVHDMLDAHLRPTLEKSDHALITCMAALMFAIMEGGAHAVLAFPEEDIPTEELDQKELVRAYVVAMSMSSQLLFESVWPAIRPMFEGCDGGVRH